MNIIDNQNVNNDETDLYLNKNGLDIDNIISIIKRMIRILKTSKRKKIKIAKMICKSVYFVKDPKKL